MKADGYIITRSGLPVWQIFQANHEGWHPTLLNSWTTREEAIVEAIEVWELFLEQVPVNLELVDEYQRLRTTNAKWRYLEAYMRLSAVRADPPGDDGHRVFVAPKTADVCSN